MGLLRAFFDALCMHFQRIFTGFFLPEMRKMVVRIIFTLKGKIFSYQGKWFSFTGKIFSYQVEEITLNGKVFIYQLENFSLIGKVFIYQFENFSLIGKFFNYPFEKFSLKGKFISFQWKNFTLKDKKWIFADNQQVDVLRKANWWDFRVFTTVYTEGLFLFILWLRNVILILDTQW